MNPLMNEPCRIELLGGLRVEQVGRVVTRFPTYKMAALLAYLAYHSQPQPREHLIELFWPEGALERGRNNLSTSLSSLRNQLEPPGVPAGAVVIADRHQVQLNPKGIHTDIQDFEHALQRAAAATADTPRAEALQEAITLYKGELLPGYYEDWIYTERQRLAEAYLQALRRLIRFHVRRKQFAPAIDYCLRALAVDPLREEAHRDLMKLYVAIGQPSAALQQYRELEQILQRDRNTTPSSATAQVVREIEALLQQSAVPANLALPLQRETGAAQQAQMLPGGTVTFLLTDLVGFTAQWERAGEAFRQTLATHHALLREQFVRHGGQEFKEVGDAFLVAFARPSDALLCAIACQRALAEQNRPGEAGSGSLQVRMALHTGEATPEAGDYHSPTLNRASRLLTAAHGGQILCSESTASLLRRDLSGGVELNDLGLYRLRDLPAPEHLFQVEYPRMLRREFPAPNAEAGFTSHLPMSFTRFFGRAREQARLQDWLLDGQTRLVTMTGIGGTGKTRLALEAARSLEEAFGGAVWFVALADIVDANLIVSAIANALRLPPTSQGDPMEQIVVALSRRTSLLILDNFEQLVIEGAPFVRELRTRVPFLTVLVTSRQTLGLEGEREFALHPLAVPGGTDTPEQLCLFESVQLFLDRAQAVKPDFQVTGQNAAAVATLCDRLEGIPLAIELAAARVQLLTPLQILAQLENRFDFLSSRRRDISERHRTLRAAMEWSYRLLSPELQRFFTRLSVFRGGWTTEAAEVVCEEPLALDYLAQLREGSLVQTKETQDTVRFHMLETVREYAAELLAEADRVSLLQRYADYFVTFAEEAASKLQGAEQGLWFKRLETEHENLRALLQMSLERPPELGMRLSDAMQRFWHVTGHLSEGRAWYAKFLAQRPGPSPERAEILHRAGMLAYYQTDYNAARLLGEESLALFRILGDKRGIARALNDLGLACQEMGDSDREQVYFEEMLATWREIGDRWRISMSLLNLGNRAEGRADTAQARAYYLESIAIARERPYRQALSFGLKCLAGIARREQAYDEAGAMYDEALRIFREDGNQHQIAWILLHLGTLATEQGHFDRASTFLQQALSLRQEIGDPSEIAYTLDAFADLAKARNESERAVTLWGAAEKRREEIGTPRTPFEQQETEQSISSVRKALGEQAFAAAWITGHRMTGEQAIAFALSPNASPTN